MDAAALTCPHCGAAAGADAIQCSFCHARLATTACASCFGLVFLGSKHCAHCGVALDECSRCSGVWLASDVFRRLCAEEERRAVFLGAELQARKTPTVAGPS